MMTNLLRAALVASVFLCVPALAAPTASSATPSARAGQVKLAKGADKKKKKDEKKPDKPVEKAMPENARADPRTSQAAPADAPPAVGGELARRGMSRIEFDDRLIQGQTNKANAIYLFERRESALRSLLKKRTDFHEEIDETLE